MEWWWDTANATRAGRRLTEVEARYIASHSATRSVEFERQAAVLNLGCGSGRHAGAFPGRWIGLDVDPVPLRLFRENHPRIPAIRADATRLPVKPGSFRVVLAMQVLNYVKLDRALAEIHRVLRPYGKLIASHPNADGYKAGRHPEGEPGPSLGFHGLIETYSGARLAVTDVTGYNWAPVGRASDTAKARIVIALARPLDRAATRWHWLKTKSPWLLVTARKVVS